MKLKILVVDDEPKIRKLLSKLILECSPLFQPVLEAANGVEALACIQKEQPDLIFLDIMMPSMTGLELLQHLEDQARKPIVVMISSYGEFDYVHQSLKHGALDYLLKPFDRNDVQTVIEQALLHRKMEQQTMEDRAVLSALRSQFQMLSHTALHARLYQGKLLTEEGQRHMQRHRIGKTQLLIALGDATFSPAEDAQIEESAASYLEQHEITGAFCERNRRLIWMYDDEVMLNRHSERFSAYMLQSHRVSYLKLSIQDCHPYTEIASIIRRLELLAYQLPLSSLKPGHIILGMDNALPDSPYGVLPHDDLRFFVREILTSIRQPSPPITSAMLSQRLAVNPDATTSDLFSIYVTLLKELSNAVAANFEPFHRLINIHDFAYQIRFRLDLFWQTISELIQFAQVSTFDGKPDSVIERVRIHLDQNYMENLSLDALSRQFFINKQHLCFMFKKKYDCTVMEYVQEKKLAKAKELLKNSTMRVADISDLLGYESRSYFDRLFKRKCGLTPSEYRFRETSQHK